MNNKAKLGILAAVLVVGIGGAAIAYNGLAAKNAAPGTLSALSTASQASSTASQASSTASQASSTASQPSSSVSSGAQDTMSQESAAMSQAAAPADADPNEGLVLAPDFTMLDTDGNEVKLSDFQGKPVVLNFWASWCPPCKQEMPDFESASKTLGEDVQFIMLNMTDGQRETVDTAKAFIASTDYTFPVYFDAEQEAAYTYGIRSIPTTYFINADGYAVTYAMGALNEAQLAMGIGEITK